MLLVWRRRREEGGLIIVNGRRGRRREDQQDERRPRGARRAPSISSFIAHFRHDARELNSGPRLRGRSRNLTYSGPGTCCVGVIIKPRHTTRHPPACNVLCSVPRTGITCANGHARVPALTHARRKDADCPPVMRTYYCHVCCFCTHPTVAHGHDTSSPPQMHAICGLRSTLPRLLPPHCICICIALHQKSTPHFSARAQVAGSDPDVPDFTRTAVWNSV